MSSPTLTRLARRVTGRTYHPRLGTPLSLRLGKASLLVIVGSYVTLSVASAMLGAVALSLLHRPRWEYSRGLRLTFEALWGLGELLREDGQPAAYYVVAGVITVLGVLLPLLLLGSFVFKLLRHDPIKWRKKASLEDDPVYGALLTIRFYPGTSSELGDLCVRVYARIALTGANPRSIVNRPLRVRYGGELAEESRIPYSASGFPCSVRVPFSRRRTATASVVDGVFDIDGHDVSKENLEIIAIVSGVVLDSGESFVSVKRYLGDEVLAGQPQWIDAVEGEAPKDWLGWDNFEGNAELVVFVYGSMVSRDSMLKTLPTLPEACGPSVGFLSGWARSWNTGSDPKDQPERVWRGESGDVFEGTIASLGLVPKDGEECPGALYRISVRDLALVDNRERDYKRINVTGLVRGPELNPTDTVFTYIPTEEAQQRLVRARANNTAVLSTGYLRSVKEGFAALFPDSGNLYERTTPKFYGRIETLTFSTAPESTTADRDPPLTS
ncbi:gamma-glutamylcyclotransferase family protein [Micromonospora sp. NPDC049051]|uniref:gamma-glutamylcyclotransferase family protein n=1 Tax=Micromonospora sp. NPDC049051 TaxID=3364264 RepID=UPI00371B41B4